MKRRTVHFNWEDEDAQACFAEWCPFPDASTSAQDVDRIEAFLCMAPPLDVLDVGCGNGRHAIELARRGYRVVGIDVAKRFLEEAGGAAKTANVAVEFRHQRASALIESNAFDFALWLAGAPEAHRTGDVHRTIADLGDLPLLLQEWTYTAAL